MRRTGSCINFVILAAVAVLPLAAVEKIPIAVMDFRVTNFQKSEFDLFLDFFSNALFETGVFDVLQRDKRVQLMKELEFSLSDAADVHKTRQIGKLLSSKLLVFGNLGKVGKNVLLSVSMVDVETGRTAGALSRTYKSLEAVFDDLKVIADALAVNAEQSMFQKKTNILYFEDFQQKKWLETEKLFYANGKYNIYSKDSVWYTWQPQVMDDFIMECEARYIKGEANTGFGMVLRVKDANNFYLFHITSTGFYSFQKLVAGVYGDIIPWTKHSSIKTDDDNLLKVSAFRNRFSLSINNVKVKEFSDETFSEGGFGFYSGQNLNAAFDNLILYQGNLVYYERFSVTSASFAEDTIAYTRDGVYHIDGKSGDTTYYSWMSESRKNLSFKAEVNWRAGDPDTGYGLTFRLLDANNNYTFLITKNGYYALICFINGERQYLVNFKKTRFLNGDGKNIMRVECGGDTFSLYLNENLVETITNTTFPQGKIGFTASQGVDAEFDNVEVFSLE